jgi:hypothetical protein
MRWVGDVDREIITILYSPLVGIPKGKGLLEDTSIDDKNIIKIDVQRNSMAIRLKVIWLK